MSQSKKPQRPEWPAPQTPAKPAETADAAAKRPGRVVHDARGNAVWDWSENSTDSTTHLLRKLDSPELSLLDDGSARKPAAEPPAGVDPYRNDRKSTPPQPPAPPSKPKKKATPPESVLKQLLGKR